MTIFRVNLNTGEVEQEDTTIDLTLDLVFQYILGRDDAYQRILDIVISTRMAPHIISILLEMIRQGGYDKLTLVPPQETLDDPNEQRIVSLSNEYTNALLRADDERSKSVLLEAIGIIITENAPKALTWAHTYLSRTVTNLVAAFVYGTGTTEEPPEGLGQDTWEAIRTKVVPRIGHMFR